MEENPAELTRLLRLARAGDGKARDDLLPRVYASLRVIADGAMKRWDSGSTLQPTALVHEAYLKLFGGDVPEFADRDHFLAVSANAMRNLLVDRARARKALKRGGEGQREAIDLLLLGFEERSTDVLDLHSALEELAGFAPDAAKVVEMRFFGGSTAEETARVLGVSTRTVEREWRSARAWLYTRLGGSAAGGTP
ncbi:MAG: ECF-type sigma factor [Planctomycetota bacterium]|nr:ECF-type sigma factor [Planctomycetota bacterium]